MNTIGAWGMNTTDAWRQESQCSHIQPSLTWWAARAVICCWPPSRRWSSACISVSLWGEGTWVAPRRVKICGENAGLRLCGKAAHVLLLDSCCSASFAKVLSTLSRHVGMPSLAAAASSLEFKSAMSPVSCATTTNLRGEIFDTHNCSASYPYSVFRQSVARRVR